MTSEMADPQQEGVMEPLAEVMTDLWESCHETEHLSRKAAFKESCGALTGSFLEPPMALNWVVNRQNSLGGGGVVGKGGLGTVVVLVAVAVEVELFSPDCELPLSVDLVLTLLGLGAARFISSSARRE